MPLPLNFNLRLSVWGAMDEKMERKTPQEILEQLQRVSLRHIIPTTDTVEMDGRQILICVSAADKGLWLGWMFTLRADLTLEGKMWRTNFPRMALHGREQKDVIRAVGRLERIIDEVENEHQRLTSFDGSNTYRLFD